MPINNTINDNDVVHGSIPIVIGANTFETSNFKLDQTVASFVRLSSKAVGNGRVSILQETVGTATLHYPSSTAALPVFGDSFSATPNPGVGSPITYACTVHKVGKNYTAGGEAMIDIEFKVNFGTVVLSIAT